jgi:hypothetical protein
LILIVLSVLSAGGKIGGTGKAFAWKKGGTKRENTKRFKKEKKEK